MIQSWKKIKEEQRDNQLYKTFILPDGQERVFPIRNDGKTNGVFAVTKDKQIILCKQFRPGPEKVMCELQGGFMKEGEEPEESARRELLEETGYTGNFILTGTTIVSAYSNEFLHSFLATDCEKVQDPQLDPTEFLDVVLMPVEEFKEFLKTGEMANIETAYMGLLKLGLL